MHCSADQVHQSAVHCSLFVENQNCNLETCILLCHAEGFLDIFKSLRKVFHQTYLGNEDAVLKAAEDGAGEKDGPGAPATISVEHYS